MGDIMINQSWIVSKPVFMPDIIEIVECYTSAIVTDESIAFDLMTASIETDYIIFNMMYGLPD